MKVAAQGDGTTAAAAIFIEEISSKISTSAQGALPKEASIKRHVQRQRRRNLPETLYE